jgi:hypothetical protein
MGPTDDTVLLIAAALTTAATRVHEYEHDDCSNHNGEHDPKERMMKDALHDCALPGASQRKNREPTLEHVKDDDRPAMLVGPTRVQKQVMEGHRPASVTRVGAIAVPGERRNKP